jgi:hypothetical protein
MTSVELTAAQAAALHYASLSTGIDDDGALVEMLSDNYVKRRAGKRRGKEEATGAKELSPEDFEKFEHRCPKCGFEWDD